MSTNIPDASSTFLRTSRNFPEEAQPLSVEINKSYVDIANAVNRRIIALYTTQKPITTGETWYVNTTKKQQTQRQLYTFTAAGNIAHGQKNAIQTISPKSYGVYTDGTNWYGVPFASSTAIAGQVSFYVTTTNIVVLVDAGAPAVTSGIIVLEWLTQP